MLYKKVNPSLSEDNSTNPSPVEERKKEGEVDIMHTVGMSMRLTCE